MIYLFIAVLVLLCIWLAFESLKHSEKNFHLSTELEIYKDFDRANRLANKVIRERNCELVDKLNAAELIIEDIADKLRIEQFKKIDELMECDIEMLESDKYDLQKETDNQKIFIEHLKVVREKLLSKLAKEGINISVDDLDPDTATGTEMHLLETLGYREEDIKRLEAENTDLKEHLQKAMDWIIRLQESKYGVTMLPVIPFLRPDLVEIRSFANLVQVEEDPKKLFECHNGLIDLERIKPLESEDDNFYRPLQWGEKEALHWSNKFYGDKPF